MKLILFFLEMNNADLRQKGLSPRGHYPNHYAVQRKLQIRIIRI